MADCLPRRGELVVGHPDSFDTLPDMDVVERDVSEQMGERHVGSVEQDHRPGEGQLHDHSVERQVHDGVRDDGAPVAQLDGLHRAGAARDAADVRWDVHLRARGAPPTHDPVPRERPEEAGQREPRLVRVLEPHVGGDLDLGRLGSGCHRRRDGLRLRHERPDVEDAPGPHRSPFGVDAHPRRHDTLVVHVDDVQQRGVGAVELDERERERRVERVLGPRRRHPRPRPHHSRVSDAHDLTGRGAGVRVVIHRRHGDTTVRSTAPEDLAPHEGGEELLSASADAASVGEDDLVRRAQPDGRVVGHESDLRTMQPT
jgi:hypothetical protein